MVYVPILKIDLPEPRLQELLPGLVTAVLGACTLVFDAVHDYLRPLTPEAEQLLYLQTITHMPKEFRKARKRIVELDIQDEDKVSEELEDASYAFFRRKMREDVAGYSDELTEDVTFRKLLNPHSATRDIYGALPGQAAVEEADAAAAAAMAVAPPGQEEAAAEAAARAAVAAAASSSPYAAPPPPPPMAALPSRRGRAAATAATGGAGLALGAGLIKLARFVSSRLGGRGKKRARQQQRRPGSQQSSRRASDSGSAAAGGGGSRAAGAARGGSRGTAGRTTPRQQR